MPHIAHNSILKNFYNGLAAPPEQVPQRRVGDIAPQLDQELADYRDFVMNP